MNLDEKSLESKSSQIAKLVQGLTEMSPDSTSGWRLWQDLHQLSPDLASLVHLAKHCPALSLAFHAFFCIVDGGESCEPNDPALVEIACWSQWESLREKAWARIRTDDLTVTQLCTLVRHARDVRIANEAWVQLSWWRLSITQLQELRSCVSTDVVTQLESRITLERLCSSYQETSVRD